MTVAEFDLILERRLSLCRDVLASRGGEYASKTDRLHNFKRAAGLLRTTPSQALLGFLTKHIVSVVDMVYADAGGFPPSEELAAEKIGDAINYLILLEAIFTEGRNEPGHTEARNAKS
jgi:hypothetical protein